MYVCVCLFVYLYIQVNMHASYVGVCIYVCLHKTLCFLLIGNLGIVHHIARGIVL